MSSARSKLLLLAAGVLTATGCGYAPTDIGEDHAFVEEDQDDQLVGLFELLDGRVLVFEGAGNPLCIEFFSQPYYADPERVAFRVDCLVYEKTSSGVERDAVFDDPQMCRVSFAAIALPERSVLFQCSEGKDLGCVSAGVDLATISTSMDFELQAAGASPFNGLVIQDSKNAALKATLRTSQTYCTDDF